MATTARTRAPKAAAKVETLEVVESTVRDSQVKGEESSATVAIAVCLTHGIEFDDIPDGQGGFKSVVFPGINSHLKGAREGILTAGGDALCVNIAKKDWEQIQRLHGKEAVFVGRNGRPPCIYEFGSVKAFKANQDIIREMRTGHEPVDPKAMGVEESKE